MTASRLRLDPLPWLAGLLGAFVLFALWTEAHGPQAGVLDGRYTVLRSRLRPSLPVGALVGVALLGVHLTVGGSAGERGRRFLRAVCAFVFLLLLVGLFVWAGTTF